MSPELFGYTNAIYSLSHGRASASMTSLLFLQVPAVLRIYTAGTDSSPLPLM